MCESPLHDHGQVTGMRQRYYSLIDIDEQLAAPRLGWEVTECRQVGGPSEF